MIRLIVEVADATDAIHVNAPVRKSYHTITIEHQELQALLCLNREPYIVSTLLGAEVINDA
jgi:hypothetical protein